MIVKVFIEREQKEIDYKFVDSERIIDLLDKLGINKETVIVAKNGKIVTEKEKIHGARKIDILTVVSGG